MKKILEQIVNKPKVKYGAGAIILKKGDGNVDEVLMIQRAKNDVKPNIWEFPRGGCELGKDKSLRDCIVREVKEETNLDVKPVKLVDKYKVVIDDVIKYGYNYVCKMINPNQEVRLSNEHQDYRWVSEVGEVELMAGVPEQKRTIQKVLNSERSIVSYPRHQKIEEKLGHYLGAIQEDVTAGLPALTAKAAGGAAAAAGTSIVPYLLPAYFSALLLKMAFDVYKNNFTKAAKACKDYAKGEKQICMLRAQTSAKKLALEKLQGSIDKCSKDRNPEQCRAKVGEKIQTMQQEIGYLMQRQQELRGKVAAH